MIEAKAVYVLWLREMIKFSRTKFRIINAIAMPIFILIFMGLGFRQINIPGVPSSIGYFQYFVPGIIGMTLLFTASMVGLSVLSDRQFGFLKEIMVTPASRVSIMLGRTLGGATTSLFQSIIIIILAVLMSFQVTGLFQLAASLVIMLLISIIFISMGLILASRLRDVHDYYNITNFLLFPVFLLSGAMFPIENLPAGITFFSLFNPLTYGVDALRGLLIGMSAFPVLTDCLVLMATATGMLFLGAYAFKTGQTI
ncbi:ABC transporter permease [Methanoregula formicica]|uniref:ABC-type polysaccharide/polyol phosphate export systems, permease component n=1 Tax=Methanoregula formicica (strain DSM 22288 / NBRC 105244 / SMSP) TaxID=593750 RepID=L0HFT0_METFS|nr:ABC transporter permease [Methanoregula formicica]AGB01944.1 ABC-type polysaccharide/polyol phosphate export systems, permease component [Methanoregula formicica SMSP]